MLCEAKVPPKTDRTVRAVQFKDGLVPVSDHVDMRRSVVVRVHDTQARKPQDGGHSMIVASNPKAWVTEKKWVIPQSDIERSFRTGANRPSRSP